MIYLDNAATTLTKPLCVKQAVFDAMDRLGNSARGMHGPALEAAREIYGARERAASFFGARGADRIVFTSNATEALNIAIEGAVKPGMHVITTEAEHNSVLRPLYRKTQKGVKLTIVKADKKGRISLEDIEKAMNPETSWVFCTHASNVTGNLLPLAKIGRICMEKGIHLGADVAQTGGGVPINMEKMGIELLCFTGHKGLLGPQGTGGLCVGPNLTLPPFKVGGSGIRSFEKAHPSGMPEALEAGTANGHGIAGLSAAFDFLKETKVENIQRHESRLMGIFYEQVKQISGVTVYGDFETKDRAAVVSLNIRDYDSKEIGDVLWQEYGIAVRAGIHCAPLLHRALGTEQQGTVRFSFSWFNTEEEALQAAWAVKKLAF